MSLTKITQTNFQPLMNNMTGLDAINASAAQLNTVIDEVNNIEAGSVTGTFAGTFTGQLVNIAAHTLIKANEIAAAGNSQGTATAVTADVTFVTGANGTAGVVLPSATPGYCFQIHNLVANNVLKIYPASNEKLNGGTANASVSITNASGNSSVICMYKATGDWYVAAIVGTLS